MDSIQNYKPSLVKNQINMIYNNTYGKMESSSKNNDNFIITRSDKGEITVVIDKEEDNEKANKHINDGENSH